MYQHQKREQLTALWEVNQKNIIMKSFQNNNIGSEVKIKKENASDIISKSMFNLSTLMVESKF